MSSSSQMEKRDQHVEGHNWVLAASSQKWQYTLHNMSFFFNGKPRDIKKSYLNNLNSSQWHGKKIGEICLYWSMNSQMVDHPSNTKCGSIGKVDF